MKTLRYAGAFGLIGLALAAVRFSDWRWALAALLIGLLVRVLLWGGLRRAMQSSLPVLVFAALLTLLESLSHSYSPLPLQAVAVFFFTTAAFRILPWVEWIFATRPGSVAHTLLLFALFVRHFAGILAVEGRRVLQARAFSVVNHYGRGSFRSLVWALWGLFSRSMTRAERFYAAQSLRGLAP